MKFSIEGEIGIALTLIGLAVTGAIMIFPTHTSIGWTLISVVAIGFMAFILYQVNDRLPVRNWFVIVGMIICGTGLLGFTGTYFWPKWRVPTTPSPSEFSGLTNAQLRAVIAEFCSSLREFDDKRTEKMDLVIQQYAEAQRKFYSNTAGQKYFNEYWNAHARDFLTVSNETNREFRDKFYMRAKEFNVELLARGVRNLNGNNMRPSMMVATILDTGDLAGVHPIRDLADYLEVSARSLP